MAKTAEKAVSKKVLHTCECGEEMKWVKLANNNGFYWFCAKCGKLVDRHGKERKQQKLSGLMKRYHGTLIMFIRRFDSYTRYKVVDRV